jgi:dTDP-4-amino-4,6-dideoxygalactose transaminase
VSSAPFIPVGRPYLDARDLERLAEPVERGWLVQGPLVDEFERGFAAFLEASASSSISLLAPHAVACASGTAALHLGVAALGASAGDEVIVPAFTWVATANCVEYAGAKPVFVDIDLETFNIDWALASASITPRTAGMIPVHLFGLPAECDVMMALARRHHLWVLEDAACGFGASWQGQPVGTFGEAGCFSFHPRKAITTGEGGMLVTQDAARASTVRALRSHGVQPGGAPYDMGDVPILGFNYRLTDLQAALGCSQLRKAHEILAHRRQVAAWYDDALRAIDALRPAPRDARATHGWQSYVCLVRADGTDTRAIDTAAARRDALISDLLAAGIGTRPGTHAPAHLSFYATKYGIRPEDFPSAHTAARCSIALPLGAGMTELDVARVCEMVAASLDRTTATGVFAVGAALS